MGVCAGPAMSLPLDSPPPSSHPLQIPQLEVWFQRASDVVRKLRYGDIDLGIVGYDMFLELADNDPDLMVVSGGGAAAGAAC
jgi:hypothetical protein